MTFKRWLMVASLLAGGCGVPVHADAPGTAAKADGVAHPAAWPAARSPAAITDRATEAEITAIIARMTVEQKVGQMIQADISTITPADLARYPLGSILAGGNSGPYGDERANAATWARLVGEFRDASRQSGMGVPILFGVDAVHGHSNLPGATIFPHNIGLGATHDPALIRRIGAAAAAEIAGSGIEWTFAPTLAVPQDLRWGRSYEGYAADPALVARYAREMTLGLQGALTKGRPLGQDRVAATAKHFLADGGTEEGKDQGNARISESELVARHAQGYPAAIDAGALTVMASFSSWNGVKNHGNKTLLTDVLKERMGFAGLVVGDWNGHGQVPGCTTTDCPQSFNAGLDLAMAPDSWKGLFENTVREVRDGTVPIARVDDAVRRILRVKAKLGLLGAAPVRRGDTAQVGAAAHLAVAREAVARSLVLLKNTGGVLPIRPGARVLITGPGADSMAMQAGGWTISWQGTDTTAADFPNGQTIGRALAAAIGTAGGQAALSADGSWSDRPDIAIVVYGEQPYAEFQGDAPDLAFRDRMGERQLVARLKSQGIRVVSVFLSGRPLFIGDMINASDAFVAAWYVGEVSHVGLCGFFTLLAADNLALVADALALVWLRRTLLTDNGGNLTNLLLACAANDHLSWLRHFKINSLWSLDRYRMRVAQRKLKSLALKRSAVTNALDIKALFIPIGNADNHVGDKRPGKPVQRLVLASIGRPGNDQLAIGKLDLHVTVDALAELALWALDGNPLRLDVYLNPRWDLDWLSSDS